MLCINPLLHNTIFREMGRLQSEAGGWLQGSLSTGHSIFLYICCANSIDVLNLINLFFINSGLNYWENPPSRSLSCKRQAQFSHRNQQSKICSQKISRPSLGPSRLRTRLTGLFMALDMLWADNPGFYTNFSGRLSEEPFPWLIQKFPCLLIFKTGQPGFQLNLSKEKIRLNLTSGRPLV